MKKHTYSISHDNKTITLTKAYAKKANTPGTKEFKELANLHKAYPDYDIVMRTATVSDSKEVHGGLTIEMMEKIIARQENAEALTKEYNEFLSFWGKEVTDKKNPLFYLNNSPKLISGIAFLNKETSASEADEVEAPEAEKANDPKQNVA